MGLLVHILIISLYFLQFSQEESTIVEDLEKNGENDLMVTVALFEKINWIIINMKNYDQELKELKKSQNENMGNLKLDLNNLNQLQLRSYNQNMGNLKLEISNLKQQQDIKTEKLLQSQNNNMENMKLELTKLMQQQNLKSEKSDNESMGSLKQEMTKAIQQQDMKSEKQFKSINENMGNLKLEITNLGKQQDIKSEKISKSHNENMESLKLEMTKAIQQQDMKSDKQFKSINENMGTLKLDITNLGKQQDIKLEKISKSYNENMLNLKLEIVNLKQQQSTKLEKLSESFKLQEIALKNTSKDIEDFKEFDVKLLKDSRKWQPILRSQRSSENFNRSWNEYKDGFGNSNGEFFIGLQKLYTMTNFAAPQELLIILQDFSKKTYYAKYDRFVIGSEEEKYKIKKLGDFRGDVTNSFATHLGYTFSTYDRENASSTDNCAIAYGAGWWYNNPCYSVLLTGKHMIFKEPITTFSWFSRMLESPVRWKVLSLHYAEMLIRPK